VNVPAVTVMPILATPLGIVRLAAAADLNPKVLALVSHQQQADGAAARLVYESRDDFFEWQDPAARALATEMLRGAFTVVAGISELTEPALRSLSIEARGFAAVIARDGCLPARSYPLTAWCAMYCLGVPEPSPLRADSGVLRLYESRLGTMFQDATNSALRMPYKSSHYAWRPSAGEMAVFPASLNHEVALVRAGGQLSFIVARLRFVGAGQEGVGRW
jgi:hypothetical protein